MREPVLQAKDVAAILNCSESHVYQLDRRGLLPCTYKWPCEEGKGVKKGNKPKEMKRWTSEEVEAFLERFKNVKDKANDLRQMREVKGHWD